MKALFCLLFCFAPHLPAFALGEARLIGISTSGQTAQVNLGRLDGIVEGEYAVLVKEIRKLNSNDLRLVPVANARNIKVGAHHSIWILYKVFDPELLVKGDPFIVLSESELLKGRREKKFGRLTVVTSEKETASQTKEALSEDKDRLSKLKDQYPEVETLHKRETRSDADGELIDVENWTEIKNERYRTALYKSPYQDDFRRQLKLSTFEKLVTAYLKKVNDPDFNYDTFYEEQMRESFSNDFRKKSNFATEYEKFLSRESQKATEDAKLLRALVEKGEAWSENFSDEELTNILKQISVLQERDRKIRVMVEPKRFTAYLGYGMNLTNDQAPSDSYRRENLYSTELQLEAVPILKHESFERFTIDAGFRSNKSAFESTNYNLSMDEISFNAGLNWYPLYSPYAVEAPALFVGTYMRTGTADIKSSTVNQKGKYTVYSLPGVRAGMKFNFKNNIGLRIAFGVETLKLERYEASVLNSVLPERKNLTEGKMNFSLAYSF